MAATPEATGDDRTWTTGHDDRPALGRQAASDAEAALQESEARFRALVHYSSDMISVVDADGVIRYANPAAVRFLGYRREELLGTRAEAWLHPDDVERMRAALARRVAEPDRPPAPMLFRVRHHDGSWRWVEAATTGVIAEAGVEGFVISSRDVGERIAADVALRQSEERFRSLVQHVSDIIMVLDAEGTIRYQSPAVERILAYRPEEVIGGDAFALIHRDDVPRVRAYFDEVRERPGVTMPIAFRSRHRDGSWRYLEAIGDNRLADPGVQGIVVTCRDVTERTLAEEALRASEARLRALVAAMDDVVLVLDAEGRYLEVAPTNPDGLYRPGPELIDRTLHEVFPPAEADRFLARIREALRTRRTVQLEYHLPIGDRRVWFHGAVSPLGEDAVVWVARDITERIRAEEQVRRLNAELERRVAERTARLEAVGRENRALLERERAARADAEAGRAYLAVLAEAGALFAAALELDATLRNVARAIVPTFADGCTVDLVEAEDEVRRVAVAHADPEKEMVLETLQRDYPFHLVGPDTLRPTLRRGEPLLYRDITDGQLAAVARDEEHLRLLRALGPTSLLILPLMTRGRVLGALSFLTTAPGRQLGPEDVDRAQLLARRAALAIENARLYRDEQRALAEARAALAVRDEFLSIASHELLTPITALKGQVQLVDRRLGRGDLARVPELARHAEAQVDRLTKLVRTLLDVSRAAAGGFALDRRAVALAPLLARVVALARGAEPGRRIEFPPPEASPVVMGDADRLELVFVNLLENARKYSPPDRPIEVRLAADGERATVVVRDEGVGIPAEEQAGIFDRFRRASNVDAGVAGMGLGLYISREIVRAHGGELSVDSTPGRGSTFTVILPRLSDAPGDDEDGQEGSRRR